MKKRAECCYPVMNDVVNFNYPENNVKGQKLDAHERSMRQWC